MCKERAQRAVCQTCHKNRVCGSAAFTSEEGTGDLSAGVHAFFKVNGKGEEVDPFAHAAHGGRSKYDGIFHTEGDRAASLSGQCAGLKGEGARSNHG